MIAIPSSSLSFYDLRNSIFLVCPLFRSIFSRRSPLLVCEGRRGLYSCSLVSFSLSLSLQLFLLSLPCSRNRECLLNCHAISKWWRRRKKRTGIGDGNRRRVDIAEHVADGRNDGHHNRAGGTDDDGPEEGGPFAGCPAAVFEGRGPEEGSGHGGSWMREREQLVS